MMEKQIFSSHYSSLSHDPSEIIQMWFLIIINVKAVVLLNIFVETMIFINAFYSLNKILLLLSISIIMCALLQ